MYAEAHTVYQSLYPALKPVYDAIATAASGAGRAAVR
jgi:hypothetical protein